MFDKIKFAHIIKKIKETYNSQEEFSNNSGIGRTYLSQYMNMKLDEPPKPKILEKLANASNGLITYEDLMYICGYSEENLKYVVFNIYKDLKKLSRQNYKERTDGFYDIQSALEDFTIYCDRLVENIEKKSHRKILLSKFYKTTSIPEDYNYISTFLFLYESFIYYLEKRNYIFLDDYEYTNYFHKNSLYGKILCIKEEGDLELFSYNSTNIKMTNTATDELKSFIKDFSYNINLSYLSDPDNKVLFDFFKEQNSIKKEKNKKTSFYNNNKLYMTPVYGKISAGIPNWAEECLEGYLPVDPNLMGIINPEECFFLKVNGQSMNKVIRDGAYALIRKQDIVENGEIAVVLVNGFDATLKRFTKQNDLVILEPLSTDSSFSTQVYDKNTQIKILGKYIGKFEIN